MTEERTPAERQQADDLDRELGGLPRFAAPNGAEARAAFARSFEPTSWYAPVLASAARASLPLVLGAIVVVYLSWAFSTASALMH